MNKKRRFNDGWEFAKSGLETASPGELSFKPVDIPHDWLIYNTLDLYENSIGWYRKTFTYTGSDEQVLLAFDGVYMDSTLYVNGQQIGEWKYGYSSFEHEITEALAAGENEIVLKVVFRSPNSRWYSGAGIYRNVWLKTRGRSHIVTDGIYVSAARDGDEWQADIETELKLDRDAVLTHTLLYKGEIIQSSAEQVSPGAGHNDSAVILNLQKLTVPDPQLWSTEAPHLYTLVTELRPAAAGAGGSAGGPVIETVAQSVGFREIRLDPNAGFFLNGKHMKLNGVCEHHDLGALGAAFNKEALRRRLRILREMGVNAIRTAHNMPAPELMDLADEMGLLVVSEAFDMWERPKTAYDYARFFKDWAAVDVKSWVRRDRNHPSLLLWSIGNEIYDTHADERGQEITRLLMAEVRKSDPKQNARVTIGSNYMPWENARKCADLVKVAGYNYAEKYYRQHHAEHPDWIIYGSETASVVQSRGVYHFPFEQSILADDDEQCSALGNSSTSWGAKSAEACILAERDTPFSLGQFIWTGFDYIGEPTPYHTKNAYFGQIDTATFPKDSYYIYQAEWTNYKERPMVHLFPYWDFNPGQMIDVRVCSNAPRVELICNGVTVGSHEIDHKHGQELAGWWKIPYREGEIKAIAYDENGRVIAADVRTSFKDARQIKLTPDKESLIANGTDLIFVEISMEDEDGRPVENANNRVFVEVTGAGRLVGLDNGDSTDYDPYKGLSRRLFSGKLMAIIAAGTEPGTIRMKVSSIGMDSRELEFAALPCAAEELQGISAQQSNRELPIVMGNPDEIPLRKIELLSRSGQHLDDTKSMVEVEAKLYPHNTTYTEVEWSVVNDAGIPSNLAQMEDNGHMARITALGDGNFRVRCTSKNGSDKIKLISELEFTASGLGMAGKDPYGFISAGLYDYSQGELGNGNERGVATSRDGETRVGFRNLDFGSHGSNEITIPIFALTSEPYPLQIWEGMPGEAGSELLADAVYQKETKWNVYQEETFRLNKRLRGITSICFVLRQKVHIKGFYFTRQNRAFAQNAAADCDHIYGDSFKIVDSRVEGIGNNVSLEIKEMDFTAEGAAKLAVYGHSPIDKNTLHVRFSGQDGESRQQLIEFAHTDGYEVKEFPLDKVTGVQNVTFIFLPGSRFDFGWFRFER
ncbi:MAG: glycoside hydrolase family 2 TIM barrel-domain containing protein [Paenibacillus macerans]|uniref:glycoside hydrolase family 2 TIM barrel-domain containing protein n=1 Tax=Paenibacillus TaxID=44249 RepID=UPI002908B44E|nr:glycoside hydrolase family 2 TIM barrel-domain containing protein [Paenibacillus macerans]MDU7474809.1 glycoside hydrolase family 2 TIM barrel-domain containing protein [Paenibacillus macerans]